MALKSAGSMPLVLASSGQMVKCPPAATTQDVMGRMIMVEKALADNLERQKIQMEHIMQELQAVRKAEPSTPSFPRIIINGETPNKKRRLGADEAAVVQPECVPSYAGMAGVQPLDSQRQNGIKMLQNIFKPAQPKAKSPRNIFFGSAKVAGEGTAASETMLAADVNLVASGVGKGCTVDMLKDFLVGKGITPVEVEMMTKPEVVNDVRTLTFRVAVKPADYEAALKPEVWPYRVAVRHYRAPRRERQEGTWQGQSERSGGHINRENSRRQYSGGAPHSSGGWQHLPPGHAGRAGQHQQVMGQMQPGPVDIQNFFSVLSALGGGMGPTNQ